MKQNDITHYTWELEIEFTCIINCDLRLNVEGRLLKVDVRKVHVHKHLGAPFGGSILY